MAKSITLSSGSILNGSPITFTIKPNNLTSNPAFHRVILEIQCGMSSGSYETIKMSYPVESEIKDVDIVIDISSVLRLFRDSYEYTSQIQAYPYVSFNVRTYDEYMIDGQVYTNQGEIYYPSKDKYLRTIFGKCSDINRILSDGVMGISSLSNKPSSSPQVFVVGDIYVYTPPYQTEQTLESSENLIPPESKEETISLEGLQTIGGQTLYALPSSESKNRTIFRFINSYGVLESISTPKVYSKKISATSNSYIISRQETLNSFSRTAIRKQNCKEKWLFTSDPLTEDWLYWYFHEFMMSEHIWIYIKDKWIPCTIELDDDITMLDYSTNDFYSISFSVDLDINGSPLF